MRWAVVVALVAGCEGSSPQTRVGVDAAHPADGKVIIIGDGDPDVPFTHLRGTATSDVVPFGGAPYCDYSVQLTNVVVDAIVHGPNEVTTLTATYHRIENALNGCQFSPAPPSDNAYGHQGGPTSDTGGSFSPALVGDGANSPMCSAHAGVTLGASPAASLTFTRTDQVAELDWTVNIGGIALAQAACTPGEIACYGGGIEGAVFTCNGDGMTLTPTTICANGCADAFSCR